jgi:hypothetical protein
VLLPTIAALGFVIVFGCLLSLASLASRLATNPLKNLCKSRIFL